MRFLGRLLQSFGLQRKIAGNFFGHVMKRGKVKHLITIGIIEGKLREKILDVLIK